MQSPYVIASIGAFNSAYCISEYRPGTGWESIVRTGDLRNLSSSESYQLEVRLDGQVVRMEVDNVHVLEAVLQRPLNGAGFGLFAWDSATVDFSEVLVRQDRLKAFVIMPFREPFDTLYKEVIKEEASSLGFQINRVDEIAGPGIVLDDIRRQIEESHVVIAEISLPNPNVFYELGYAHALGKPAVLLVRREEGHEIPFDLRGYRAIFYDDTIGGKNKVQAELRRNLQAIQHDS